MIEDARVLQELSKRVKTIRADGETFRPYTKDEEVIVTADEVQFFDVKTGLNFAVPRLTYLTKRKELVMPMQPMMIPTGMIQDMELRFDASYWACLAGQYDQKKAQFRILDPFKSSRQEYNALVLYTGWNWLDGTTNDDYLKVMQSLYGERLLTYQQLDALDGYSGESAWVLRVDSGLEDLPMLISEFALARANGILKAAGVKISDYEER